MTVLMLHIRTLAQYRPAAIFRLLTCGAGFLGRGSATSACHLAAASNVISVCVPTFISRGVRPCLLILQHMASWLPNQRLIAKTLSPSSTGWESNPARVIWSMECSVMFRL
jgi:hypothetical protein